MVREARWLSDYWPTLVLSIGTIGVSISSMLLKVLITDIKYDTLVSAFATPSGGLFGASVAGLLIATITTARRSRKTTELQDSLAGANEKINLLGTQLEQSRLSYRDLFDGQLAILSNVFNFGDTERISVYKHDGMAFVMLARYSKNPEFRKPGRAIYPDNEGCIGAAWTDGEAFENALPDAAVDRLGYINTVFEKWRVRRPTIRKFKMRSRSYAAFAINDPTDRRRIAVIVFESMSVDTLDRDRIRTVLTVEGRRLAEFLESMRTFEPQLTYAREEGY